MLAHRASHFRTSVSRRKCEPSSKSLRASRARIVEAGDAERADSSGTSTTAPSNVSWHSLQHWQSRAQIHHSASRLDAAETSCDALAELREIAHGIYPVALAEDGLSAAVEACRRPALRSTRRALRERLDPKVEAAAYFVVAELVRRGGALRLRSDRQNGTFVLSMESDNGFPSDLVDLEDRVGALDGRLVVEPGTLRVEIPCA